MIIFIDSNIFFNKWTLDDIHFQLLFNFLANSRSKLFISDLVCEEVDNLYLKSWQENIIKARPILKTLSEISPWSITISLSDSPEHFSLKERLNKKCEYENIIFFTYNSISQTEVVRRAIQRIRPFQENEKGYRDTLIWLSFLQALKTTPLHNITEISFISNNRADFYNNQGKNLDEKIPIEFLPTLLKDITDAGVKMAITPYFDLASFIRKNVATDLHEYSYAEFEQKFIAEIESDLEMKIVDLINGMSPAELEVKAVRWHRNYPIRSFVKQHTFEMMEGIEDLEVTSYKRLKDQSFFVSLSFNFRRCALIYSIDTEEYFMNKPSIDKTYDDVECGPEETILTFYFRAYFDISTKLINSADEIDELIINRMEFH